MATNQSSRSTKPVPASSLVSTFILLLVIFALAALVGTLASCSTSKIPPSNPLPPEPSPPGETGGALGQAVKYKEQIQGDYAPPYEVENHYLQSGMFLRMPNGEEPFFFQLVDATPIVDEQQGATLSTAAIAPGGLVYNKGYYYSKQGWVPFAVVPDVPEGDDPQQWIKTRRDENGNIIQTNWVRIKAKAGLHFSAQEFYDAFPEGQNFIVNYVCLKPNPLEPWKCGCKAPAEGEGPSNDCGYWMVQTFDVCSVGEEWDDNARQCSIPSVVAEAAVVEEEQAPPAGEVEEQGGEHVPAKATTEESTASEGALPSDEQSSQPSEETSTPISDAESAAPAEGETLIGAGGSSASGPAEGGVTGEEAAPQEAPQETITPTEEAPTDTTPLSDVSSDTGIQEQQPVETQPIVETQLSVEETPPVALTATCTVEPSPYDGSDMALCIPTNTPIGEGMGSYFTTSTCFDASTVLYPVCGSDGSCLVDSSNTFDCAVSNMRCDGGQCVQKKVDGDVCTSNLECVGGTCVGGTCATPTPETVQGGETTIVETSPTPTPDATTTSTSSPSMIVQDAAGNAVNDVMVQFSSEAMGESIRPPELLTTTTGSTLPVDAYTLTFSKAEYASVTLHGIKLPSIGPLAVVLSPLCTQDTSLPPQCPAGLSCVPCPAEGAVQCSSNLYPGITSACAGPTPREIGELCSGNADCASGMCSQGVCAPSTLYGTLRMFTTALPDDTPVAGAFITIIGQTGTFETTSDQYGEVKLLIPQGTYDVRAVSSDGVLSEAQATVLPSKSLEVWLRLGFREIQLTVYGPDNFPFQGSTYDLVDVTDRTSPRIVVDDALMIGSGSVMFSLPYGVYEITVTPPPGIDYSTMIHEFTVGPNSPHFINVDVTLQLATMTPGGEGTAGLSPSCSSDADCQTTERCNLPTLACVPLLYDGGFEVSEAVRLVTAPPVSSSLSLGDPATRAAIANPHEWVTLHPDASITTDMVFSGAKSLQIYRPSTTVRYVTQASPLPAGTYLITAYMHVPASGGMVLIKFISTDASRIIKYQNLNVISAQDWQTVTSQYTLQEDSYLFVGIFPGSGSGMTHWDDVVVERI